MAEALADLVLTDEELALIAARAGAEAFPGVRVGELDEAAWDAVARGLLARGLLRPPGEDEDEPPAAIVVAEAVLAARDVLWLQIAYAEAEGDDRVEALWFLDDLLVRQTIFPGGLHAFRAGVREDAAAFVDAVLAGTRPGLGDPPPGPDDARRIIAAEGRRMIGEDRVEGETAMLVESPDRGLWLMPGDEIEAAVPTAPDQARDRVVGLAGLATEGAEGRC